MDVNGASPCTSLSAGTVRRTVDLRTQRCDSTVGAATWADVRVLEANLTAGVEFDSLIVTVRDGTSGATLLTQQMVGTNGILSLAGINATTHPSLTLDATSESVGDNVPWADGNPPRLELRWNSDPTDGCFRTTTVINCPTTTNSSIGVDRDPGRRRGGHGIADDEPVAAVQGADRGQDRLRHRHGVEHPGRDHLRRDLYRALSVGHERDA